MKKLKVFSFFFALIFGIGQVHSQEVPPGRDFLKIQECNSLNVTIRDSANTALLDMVRSIESTGFIKFDVEKMQNNGGLDSNLAVLGMDAPNSFVTLSERDFTENPEISFIKAQQYYNGILVEGGGYALGLINCVTFFMNAYIMENINIDLIPDYSKQQVITILQNHEGGGITFISTNPEDDIQLLITRDLTESCDYILAWKMIYKVGFSEKITYVNAETGAIIKEVDGVVGIDAETMDYGTRDLNDFWDGAQTILRTPDNSVITYDFTNVTEGDFRNGNFTWDPNDIPTTGSQSSWPPPGSDNHIRRIYQAHYVSVEVKEALLALGFPIPAVTRIGANLDADGAWVRIASRHIGFGREDSKSFALFDVAGHEFAHTFLLDILNFTGEPAGIQEAICDMIGTYAEFLITGSHDWMIGGDNGLKVRDMANTVWEYYDKVKDFSDPYILMRPLDRWFTILADGGTYANPPYGPTGSSFVFGLGLEASAELIIASLDFLAMDSDYFDVRAATILAAEQIYGECSNEVESVVMAWYLIGVGEKYLDECGLQVEGSRSYCEETLGTIDVNLTLGNPVSGFTYEWSFPFGWTALGQSAPQAYVGTNLIITGYDNMTTFPRYYTILLKEYDDQGVFQRHQFITIQIRDCNNDDPQNPCEEDDAMDFYVTNPGTGPIELEKYVPQKNVVFASGNNLYIANGDEASADYRYAIFDISGRRMKQGWINGEKELLDLPSSGIYILHIYDNHELVQVEKIACLNR